MLISASGKIGKMMTRTLTETAESIRALVRDKNKLADLESDALDVLAMELENDFRAAFDGMA